jgi:TetR/AcrR family transcriptional regulator, ethionamide resistance regulator
MASVTRKRQSSRAARRDEIRHRLLEVVERLLDDGESFTEISVERMVAQAKLARSTFYLYFQDKGDLLVAWFAEITGRLEDAARGWWNLGPEATRDDLRDALGHIVKTYRPHTTLMAAMYDAAAYDPEVRALVTAMMNKNIAGLRAHIRAGQKSGSIDPDLLPDQTARWLTWMAERGLHQLVRTASDAELERLVDAFTSVIWNTLYAPARAA